MLHWPYKQKHERAGRGRDGPSFFLGTEAGMGRPIADEQHLLRRVTGEGYGYSVVELSDTRQVLAIATGGQGGDLWEQAREALQTIGAVHNEQSTHGSIVHQTVFVARPELIPDCRTIISDFYGEDLPATTYIAQPICQGKLFAIETLGVGRDRDQVQIERFGEQLVRVTHSSMSWLFCAGIGPRDGVTGIYNQTISALSRLRGLLAKRDVGFDHVIRTWYYLGVDAAEERESERYGELDRARTAFFEGVEFLAGCQMACPVMTVPYPASTSIGTQGRDVLLGCIALQTDRPEIVAMSLENPSEAPLLALSSRDHPEGPKFARAMVLSSGTDARILVSGTASNVKPESQYFGDAEVQTRQILDAIEALISENNLRRHGLPGLGSNLENLGTVRVYIKRQDDFEKVRAICQSRLEDVPAIYTVADLLRPDLLVKVEGIAFSKRR
jgi:enamine deaminase RidA (YjgF/YER057c/UK114 family)